MCCALLVQNFLGGRQYSTRLANFFASPVLQEENWIPEQSDGGRGPCPFVQRIFVGRSIESL
jgi:hypothetical protein